MNPFPIRQAVFAVFFASTLAIADDGSNPLSGADKVMTLNFNDGTVTDCRTMKEGAPERTETLERLFTRMSFDNCLWEPKVDLTDRSSPLSLFRVGADLSCTLEEVEMKSMPEPDEKSLSAHLRGKGLDDVKLISSTKAGDSFGTLRHQVLRGRMPLKFGPERPVYEFSAWMWSGLDRLSTFICVGPEMVMQADTEKVKAVADSMKFGSP
jgi:hypothetical protein